MITNPNELNRVDPNTPSLNDPFNIAAGINSWEKKWSPQ